MRGKQKTLEELGTLGFPVGFAGREDPLLWTVGGQSAEPSSGQGSFCLFPHVQSQCWAQSCRAHTGSWLVAWYRLLIRGPHYCKLMSQDLHREP